jgi:hypothetical protein
MPALRHNAPQLTSELRGILVLPHLPRGFSSSPWRQDAL